MSAKLESYSDVIRRDGDGVPDPAPAATVIDSGPLEIPVEVYTSRRYHELEKQHIWSKCWQMACREEHIPEPGDQHIYDICDKSYLIVRGSDNRIRAYVNACLHRGRRLRNLNGNATAIRCSYHGFTWDLEGDLRYVPCPEEFSYLPEADWKLPELAVATWGGYVFINPDPEPTPFANYIAGLPEYFHRWPLEDRYVAKHVVKKLRCNWKVAQEAFMEALHVSATHPQAAWASGDGPLTLNDRISDNIARTIMPRGVTSPYLNRELSEDEISELMMVRFSRDPSATNASGAPNRTARERYADVVRGELREIIGAYADQLSIGEVCDGMTFTVYPNLHPWGAFYRNSYLFKPLGDDHETCVFELMVLAPFKGERPPPSVAEVLELDDSWTAASIGASGPILDQDTNNIQQVQSGLRTTSMKTIRLASKQEAKIRWFYERYSKDLPGVV